MKQKNLFVTNPCCEKYSSGKCGRQQRNVVEIEQSGSHTVQACCYQFHPSDHICGLVKAIFPLELPSSHVELRCYLSLRITKCDHISGVNI